MIAISTCQDLGIARSKLGKNERAPHLNVERQLARRNISNGWARRSGQIASSRVIPHFVHKCPREDLRFVPRAITRTFFKRVEEGSDVQIVLCTRERNG